MKRTPKKVVIKNSSFVGLGSRSKSGCFACRRKKKKCDEIHPVCGLCSRKKTECVWREPKQKKSKYSFDMKRIVESQKMINLEKVGDNQIKIKPKTMNNSEKISTLPSNESLDLVESTADLQLEKTSTGEEPSLNVVVKTNTIQPETMELSMLQDHFDPDSFGWYNSPQMHTADVSRAVDELMDDANMLDDFIDNVVEHIKSPAFDPNSNYLDLSMNNVLKHTQHYILQNCRSSQVEVLSDSSAKHILTSPLSSSFNADHFIEINSVSGDEKEDDAHSSNPAKDVQVFQKFPETEDNSGHDRYDDGVEEYDSNDTYHPMDESQLLENLYISDTALIEIFKSKKLHPYLKPAVHFLLSKNNSLKVINPSSPIMNQLDSTGKLFLENYVTNLAMNQLDIGNNQFFLDYALSEASTDPAILFCLVAWGGMFLVGRDNELATMYFNKSLTMMQKKRDGITKANFDNDQHLKLLLSYLLLACAQISTGDVGGWFQMFLHCKDLLNDYGGLKQFVLKNKSKKVAQWIASNIFYHDVLCTRTSDFGTLIAMHEYKDVFKTEKFSQNGDFGLNPFYGLSQNLYLLLGEIANNRKILKNLKFPLNFIPVDGLSKEIDMKYYRETENSWFEIFDFQILNCKPPYNMIDLLMKSDPGGKLLEHHLTWYELTQISLRIYIRINFKETEFDNEEVQELRTQGMKLFKILIGTKLQTLLGFTLLMLGVTSTSEVERANLTKDYHRFMKNYQILNVQVCWEVINQVWSKYDEKVQRNQDHYVDWTDVINAMGWNCCFT